MSCDKVNQVELAMKKGKSYDFMDFADAVESINQTKVNVKSMILSVYLITSQTGKFKHQTLELI